MSIPLGPDDSGIADANFLFEDAEKPARRAEPAKAPIVDREVEGYGVLGEDPSEEPEDPPTRPPIAERPRKKPVIPNVPDGVSTEEVGTAQVITVWTRWGEWGPTLLRMAAVGFGTILFVYLFGGLFGGQISALIVMVAGLAILAMAYPIAITLERPVRLTPEQAIKDYFAALSHHYPAYRRMWLLLSEQGRQSGGFGNFEAFRSAMKRRLAELARSGGKSQKPLAFEVADFRAEKSAGLKTIDATYTLRVSERGAGGEPLDSWEIATTLVRGPDSMWYLNSGVIPRSE